MTMTLDYTNMMADAIGPEYGITDEELGGLSAQAKAYHEKIRSRRKSGDLAFYELPYQDESLAEIVSFADQLQGAFDDLVVLGIGGSALQQRLAEVVQGRPGQRPLEEQAHQAQPGVEQREDQHHLARIHEELHGLRLEEKVEQGVAHRAQQHDQSSVLSCPPDTLQLGEN